MLIKAFHNLGGVWAAASEVPRGGVNADSGTPRKPSNLVVRAALKRKRLATAASTKSEPAKPA
jgi:hypothetical protein